MSGGDAGADDQGARARYVAIITDGNGRWAKRRGLPVIAGHEAGADTVKARLRDAADLGIEEMTVYSFSTENWGRSEREVSGLMEMFKRRIEGETPELHDEGVRMRFIGRRAAPVAARAGRAHGVGRGADRRQHRITLFVAFNYGGRAEIIDAARTFTGGDEDDFRSHLYAPDMHDPDLIIRTSGELRSSNFLIWQGSTPSSCSATSCGRTSRARRSKRASRSSRRRRRLRGSVDAAQQALRTAAPRGARPAAPAQPAPPAAGDPICCLGSLVAIPAAVSRSCSSTSAGIAWRC